MELHGGSIAARRRGDGQGACFTVTLPAWRGAPVAPGPDPSRPDRIAGRALRVLIVDDNRDAADTLGELVDLLGHESVVAYDPAAALARAAERLPDVALCDIGLPGMNGYELARRLRALSAGHDLRIFALSGYAQPDDLARAAEAGFEAHLAKPADPEMLARLLRSPRE
jgi:CheY-like chemotaxis protein